MRRGAIYCAHGLGPTGWAEYILPLQRKEAVEIFSGLLEGTYLPDARLSKWKETGETFGRGNDGERGMGSTGCGVDHRLRGFARFTIV